MAKKIRFPLEMKDGVEVRNIEELKENFSLEQILFYLSNGKLETWLRDRYYDDIADAISELDQEDVELSKKICNIFEVEYEENEVDVEEMMERKRKIELLKDFTDEKKFFDVVEKIAFEQDDIYDLLDEGETTIYLCGDKFSIPLAKKGIRYIGVNSPTVVISSKDKVDFEGKKIIFENVHFDEKYQKILNDLEQKKETVLSKKGIEDVKDCYGKISIMLDALKYDIDDNEMRIMKFEMMVRDIAKLGTVFDNGANIDNRYYLALIYDYDDLNDYGKAIIEQGEGEEGLDYFWMQNEIIDQRKSKAREFVEKCNKDSKRQISLWFVFWEMMMLTVDDTDKEKHLSLICDFARMLKISDEEMLDILKVIQVIYHKAEDRIEFNSESIPNNFARLLIEYDYQPESDEEDYDSSIQKTIASIAVAESLGMLFKNNMNQNKLNVGSVNCKEWVKKTN